MPLPGTSGVRRVTSNSMQFGTDSIAAMKVRNNISYLWMRTILVFVLQDPLEPNSPGASPPFPRRHIFSHCNFAPLISSPIMPRERGKPKRGPKYYSYLGRHRRPGPFVASTLPPAREHPCLVASEMDSPLLLIIGLRKINPWR
jgi:hypothetical protein